MTGQRRRAVVTAPILALACALGGCGAPAGTQAPASPSVSVGPSPALEATVAPDVAARPPAASLAVEGGEPVVAQLGTYAWGDTGSDSPWLPGAPLAVGGDETLHVTFDRAVDVAEWTARFVPSAATGPAEAQILGSGAGPGSFVTPPAGSWTVEVHVTFAGGVGEASYFWKVAVD
ncbi:MAG: hypothetical protein ACRDIL_06825 [Candidatus Limnocylindrales bacterium]